ncbi:Dystonin 230 kDa bullous pemphigoid antigen 230/240 kDa bullous pemphigoid antigen [Collichthys lucidus]|uniref:Dystonin 230 kDa bullous pemphigoid antigen 230/240 kDa bullous pemphigoid antigen n=1 Tax=Collichthys lucidus TaxID=240159 RepID=A0A4U5VBJ4_COLLU|nr:Dystonin 230 kDa bullous pemphigoid antigen 230/240 kDa bullous pemphigoid antigen [Collichthys lucidus]
MAYLSGISSVSNSSFTSFGSNDTILSEPLQINSSVFLNNNIAFGSSRLEMLQQIANRVQRDCVNGEDKLALARTALQSDAKRLESGIQFLNEAEIAGYLLECENILRQQVLDIQILLDGKFPFADQLVQRVSKLRDDLLALRAECSSVYSKGRTLTTEQTKMMISGITQSLNSGFSQNINTSLTPALTPALTPGGLGTPGSTFTSSLTPCLTPSLTPALTPGLQPASVQSYMGSGGGMDPGSLRHLKHMQIRKPLMKSSLADPNMTEEEVNMKFVQDLLNWVEDMQVQLDRSEWGSDLPSVEMHLENHKSVHRAIEEFQMSLKDAKLSEIQMNMPLKLSYSDKLNKLEKQYEWLLSCSRERQSHLESLYDFVSKATQELIWLNEKEEEEVAFDWSDRNSNISKKRDYHADLMRELDEKEEVIKSVQDKAERLMLKNHPARLTIEAYRAAMQTQWSWILQLCSCVEQHLKENAVYFEFFSNAKESMDYLKNLQDAIHRKYSCDRTSSLHRLEDLTQESMDEKEQLLQYRSTVAGLVGRAKNIVQLRPRNPESPVRSSIPVKAICDYRQIEITIYKDDECVLANNSHRAKWKVINPAGNEAMVPAVCFTVPPPNKEAVDMATRIEQLYQNVLALWHHSHINMKSVVSWHYLMADIQAIRNWNVSSIKTMLPGEHQQVLSNLQSHFDEFLEDSEESEVFTVADCSQLERDVAACKEYYQELLRSAERGKAHIPVPPSKEHEESVYNHYISEIRNFRMHLEAHEEHLIRQLRTPLERDDLEQSLQRITEHEKKTAELNKLKEDLEVMKDKCEQFLRQAAGSPSVPTLSSELTILVQSMSQVYSMSSIYMDKLKTVSLVVKHSQSAEALVKTYESKLYEEDAMNSDVKSIESVISTLKQWRTEIDEQQGVFHDMEDELQKARVISDRMFKAHNERDFDLDWHKEKADQLSERWQNAHSQIDSRLRDLDGISKSLKHYRDSYSSLDEWIGEMEAAQLKVQENKPEDSKALAELLNKQKVLVAEIEQKQSRIDECQKYSEQYSSSIKDYELQLMTFRAMVDSQHKSPLKKRRMQSSSDAIQQEFMDLRTRYTALVTLMTQYVKFASETLKRTEDEEHKKAFDTAENAKRTESMELQKAAGEVEISRLKQRVQEQEAVLVKRQAQLEKLEGKVETQRKTIDDLTFQKSQLEHDVCQYCTKLEIAVKDKAASEQELIHTKQVIEQTEAKWSLAQRKLEDLLKKTNDGQDLKKQSPKLQRKINVEEVTVQQLQSQVQAKANDLAQQPLVFDSQSTVNSEPETSAARENDSMMVDALQQKVEELVLVQKRAEMAEEKAQSYKKLLDDSNNRLKKLQIDMESERNNMRQKSDDLQQETLNLKKSISELQEEVRSLQRAKSSLEQNAFFQSTEVEGLKEQLKITRGELHKKSSMEQENIYKTNNLEEDLASKQAVIDQLKFKCNELTRVSITSDSDIRSLQIQIESLEKERSFSEQKIRSLKSELESWKQQLQTAKDENMLMKRSEQASQLKCTNLEAELQKSELIASHLQKNLDELKQINAEMEKNLKNMRDKLDQVTIENDSKDQQIKIFKSQVEGTKSQVKIIEEELNKKSQTSHELQMKLQDYNEEVRKTTELQQKIETLNSNIAVYETEITTVKAELKSMFAERNSSNQKILMQNAEINDLNIMIEKKNAELQKESTETKNLLNKVKELEDELFKHKNSIKGLTSSSEKMTETLKQEMYLLQNDKLTTEKKVENLNVKLSEFSSSLQRTKDELMKETKERKAKESKILQLENELQKNKVTMKEVMSSSDKSRSNLQQENTILKKEKAETLEKNISLGSEVRMLKEKVQRFQTETEQKQKENSVLQLKSRQMEEQLEKCKKMLDELKSKLELQKEGYERQLLLVQTEIEKKLFLLRSEISSESGKHSDSGELAEMLDKYLRQDVKQINTVYQTTVETKQQTDQQQIKQLQIKLDKLQQERTNLGHDLSKAKSQITQLEEDKLKLNSKISQMQSLCNEHLAELAELKQLLTDSEWKLTLKDKEARSLQEQIELYVKEVKSLQDKLLMLDVLLKTNSQKTSKQDVTETSHHYMKDNEAALLKTEHTVLQRTVPSYESAKCNLGDEILKMKVSQKMSTMGKENILEGLKQVRQDKIEVTQSQSLYDSPTKKVLNSSAHQTPTHQQTEIQNVTSKSQVKPDEPMSLTTHGYMALCGLKDSHSITRTYQISETYETVNTSESEGKLSETYSTSQKHPELKGSTSIQSLVKFKFLDEEVLRKLDMGLITVEEVQASISQHIGKPTTIAGVYVESSKKKMSFLEAAEKGFLAKTYALEFLEAQAATGSLTDLATGQTLSVVEAMEKGIIEASLKDKLMEAEKAAMEERILDRYRGKKILEVQVATGGLINPKIGVRVPASIAVDQGLLNEDTLHSLHDPVSNPKGFHNPDTGQKAYYSEILKTCLYDIDGGVLLFPYAVVASKCRPYEAFKGRHIDKRTYLFLSQQESEWQEKSVDDSSGSSLHIIADVKSGRQLCLESALSQRFLETSEFESYRSGLLSIYEIADIIFSRMVVVEDVNSPIAGFWDITQRKRLSVLQGFQQGFTDRATALRLLEAQACTWRSVDEEKREHGDKVSKLLHWMSNVKQTPNNDGNALKDSNANTDASNKPQVSVEEMVTKKEQIAEALRATQMMLNKHSDKMTEEEKEKAQEQLKALNQAYNELSKHCSDQTTSAEEDFKSVDAGPATGPVSGLNDQITSITLSEAQPVTSNSFLSESRVCMDWEDSFKQDLTYKSTVNHLPELNESSKCLSSHVSSVSLSDIAAAREGATCEEQIIKMIEVKQDSDGLRNKSLTSGRNVNTLRSSHGGLSDQEAMMRMLGIQVDACDPKEDKNITAAVSVDVTSNNLPNGDRLKVDAAVQCDLLSSSSTLTVLGYQQQFMGLVLPSSGEIETVSTTFQSDQQVTTDEFISRLVSNREKIAALYIPENSEVVDINSAIQNGLIDNYTAQVLTSIEIPDVFSDIDHLNEKFSSWLMYKKLIVDGCYHAADCLKVDIIPTYTEAKQLFISYLMINSYIDPTSGQRVLILDKQLSKMIQIFLEDSILSENIEKNVTSLSLKVGDLSEQIDLESPLEINEETDDLFKHACDPYNFVSSINGNITLDEKDALTQDPVEEVSVGNDSDMDTAEPGIAEKTMCQSNISWTKSGEFGESSERICGNCFQIDVESADSEGPDQSVLLTLCSVNRTNVGSPSRMFDSEYSVKFCHQTLPCNDAESLPSESEGTNVREAEFLCSEDLMEGVHEEDDSIHLLKAQMIDGSISDVTSGRPYDLEAALSKGLVDETAVLLDTQSDEGSAVGDEEGAISVLKQTMSDGSVSNIALPVMEQQSLSGSGGTISISESAIVKDESEPEASIYPEENSTQSIPDDYNLGLVNINEAENMQQAADREVAVMVLEEAEKENKNRDAESLLITLTNQSLLPEDGDSHGVIDSQLTDAADVFSVENAAPASLSRPTSLSDRNAGVSTDPDSQTQYATSASHSSHTDHEFFITGCDAEVGNQTESRINNDTSAVQSPLHNETIPNRHYSLPEDLVESAIISVCVGNGSYDNNITEDGSTVTLPQREGPCSENDFSCIEPEPRCSQNGQSMFVDERSRHSPVVSDEVTATNPLSLKCLGVEDSEDYTSATTRVSLETELADTDLSGSRCIATDENELNTDVLSPEWQHEDIFTVTSDTEQISVSRNAQIAEKQESDEQNVGIGGKVSASEMNSGQSDTVMEAGLGSDIAPEEKRLDVCASERPRIVTDFLSDSYVTSDVSSSSPSMFSDAIRTCVDDKEENTEGSNVSDLQKAQTEDVESTIATVPNPSTTLRERHILWKHTTHLWTYREQSPRPSHGFAETKLPQFKQRGKRKLRTDAGGRENLSMLQEVMDTLNTALGGEPQEDRRHILESIKEESSEGEDEGSAEDNVGVCHSAAGSHQPSPQSSDACKVEQVKNKVHLKSTYQKHLSDLDELAGVIQNNSEMSDEDLTKCDVETLKRLIQQNKDTEGHLLKEARLKLEDITFDIQCFISEHTQFLSPAESSYLLKFLSTTQRAFRNETERLVTQRSTLDVLLDTRERETQEQSLLEKHKEFTEKLAEVCDNLTLTENHLIGHQQQAENAQCVTDLQQYQQEHQALQKDVLTNASALNEVITSTKKFLEENRSKLTPEQIAILESKLEEAKNKASLINQRAEESRKDLEKVVTTAIKQESEKAAAVERLEESKNKIEGLLDWISNIGNANESVLDKTDHISKENGNLPEESSAKGLIGEDDDANGNDLQTTEKDFGRETSGKSDASLDLDKQYERVKARHQEILSQQQDLIIATQSAQALLDKQADVLSPEEKEKLQKNIQDLKGRYEASLTQAEQQMKQVQCVQEELKKFQDDCVEFVNWLDQAEGEIEELGAPAGSLNILSDKLQRQKSFSEDVISHKGDLRFITISGQKVLDVAGACGLDDPAAKNAQLHVNTSGTCSAVKDKLDSVASRYKMLHSQCNQLGNNLKDVVDKYNKYDDASTGLLKWLNGSEEEARKQQSEPIAADPQTLQKQLEETKASVVLYGPVFALQGQMTGHQIAIDTLRKTAESLITSDGDLLSNSDEIQETVDDIVERYDNLSKSVSDRNEKLQITLTRSMSVQDGLDEMMGWMEGVEASVKEKGQIPLDSASIGDILSKEAALEQDIASRQSSISAMKAKVKKFVETADPSAAALLQSKMDTLSQRFSDACDKHKQKVSQLEQLKEKVEQFEEVADKVQQFVVKRSQDLHETEGPGKTFNELSQLMQGLLDEWTSKGPAVQDLNSKGSALCSLITFLTSPAKTKTPSKSELMGIQQNMSFVNEGYTSLGETLKSRAAELSGSVQEVKEAQKETENMMTWLKDMKKTAASWNNAATEKDSVKTQLEQQKAFEEDMKQKRDQLQKLREKLLNLIQTHPNSPEAAKWKQMLAEIDAAWADISGSVEERKQHLEQSNKNLDIFQTTEMQLGQWLSEKELMMSVLGPLSIDLNMLKMQKQQVQILQNEFKSRKPQYEQLEEAASAILSSSDNQDPSSGKLVREQLADVTQKWQGLTAQLDQRDSLIDQAAVKTGQFQELVKGLSQTVTQLENDLTKHQGQSTQPDAVKKQLEDVHNISGQLRDERRKLKEAEAINAELTAMVTEDYLKADLARQLESVSKPFKQLEEKAAKRIEQLNSTFASSQQFHQTSKDFQSWLGEKLQDQSKPLPISAKVDTLQQTLEQHKKLALQGQLTTLSSNWEEVKKSSAEQADKLQTALQRSLKYQEHAEKLSSWIQECEASEGRVKLTVDPVAVESSISQVKALQKDVDKHRGMVEQLNTAADSLLEVANTDTEAVKEEKASIGKRVDNVVEGLQNKRDSLEKISYTVKEFNDAYKEAKGQLEGAKKQGVQAHSNKNLANMKAQHKSLEGVQNQVDHLKILAKELVVDVPDADGVTDLLLQADSVEKDYGTLNKKLEETCQVLEGKLQGIGQFQNSIQQQDSIQSFVAKLQELMANTANAGDSCKKMLETETSPDLLGLKRDLDALSKQCGKLLDRAKGREVQVQSTLTKLEELYGKLHQAEDKLCNAVDKEASQEAVGMETDVINQQLEAFKITSSLFTEHTCYIRDNPLGTAGSLRASGVNKRAAALHAMMVEEGWTTIARWSPAGRHMIQWSQ